MARKKRKPLPRIGGKAVTLTPGPTPSSLRTARTPEGQEITNKLTAAPAGADFLGYGNLEAPEVRGVGVRVTTPDGTVATTDPTGTRVSSGLPYDAARKIIDASNKLKVDPDKMPDIPDDEVRRLITEHPDVALEGLTRLGRVTVVPHARAEGFHFDPLEIKARVVGDMHRGNIDDAKSMRVMPIVDGLPETLRKSHMHLNHAIQIDAQAVYDRWMAADKGNDLYELRLAPPWANGLIVYSTPAGNVWALHMLASDLHGEEWTDEFRQEIQWEAQPPADHTIEWDRVRWVASVQVYAGGYGQQENDEGNLSAPQWVQTVGPLMIWRMAIYEDGTPADLHWTHIIPAVPMHKFNNALGVLTETLNMLNSVNVTLAHPDRSMPRAQRRRFDRMGVRFSEIHVRPVSKSYRGKGTALADMEMPLHGVRGHYATYGSDGRGLLFGKHAGRFWIPPHVRGSAEHGTTEQSYVAEAE